MNDRLLKESDVLRAVDKRIEELSKDPVFIRKNGQRDLYGIKKYLLAIPTADRPQGEWIKNNLGTVICSECKRPRRDNRVNHINFCNSCGARMRPELQGKHFDSIIIDESAMKGADDE